MSEHIFTPGPGTERAYRDALGCFGTGVTVVTALSGGEPLAMTASSFASVSIDPPIVLWCPARASARHDAFVAAHEFAIHVMAEDQQPLATHFARTGTDFGGIDWHPGDNGLPHLNGCLARFVCTRCDVHDGGDHSIVLGRVVKAQYRPGSGLMFKRGQYGGFAGLD